MQETSVFFCDWCNKQYVKITEWENHLSSYDHHHTKRFREMQVEQRARNKVMAADSQCCTSLPRCPRPCARESCRTSLTSMLGLLRKAGAPPKKERKDPALVAAAAAAAASAAAVATAQPRAQPAEAAAEVSHEDRVSLA